MWAKGRFCRYDYRQSDVMKPPIIFAVLLLCVFGWLPIVRAQEEPRSPRDLVKHLALAKSVISELQAGNYDLLESQYQDFKTQIQPDGTPKIWVYWSAFEMETGHLASSQEEAEAFAEKARQWLGAKPGSVPALLALSNALIGECERIRDQALAAHIENPDAETIKTVQSKVEEIKTRMESFAPETNQALQAESQFYVCTVRLLSLVSVDYSRLSELERDLRRFNPYYVPFYIHGAAWLFQLRSKDPSAPRPEVWVSDHLKPNPLDSEEDRARKCRAYAQTISFNSEPGFLFKLELLDWPTFKAGLRDLVQSCGPQTDWPTRYLVDAYGLNDKAAAREALSVIRGNYSVEIITDPEAFQDISRWAEAD
jgi:hypothetical protein